MTERENELKAALAENGTFDSEKAGRFAADGVLQLHRQLKKNDRFLAITTLMCVALLAFCIEKLIFASSTKAIVGFGVTLLYVLVFTVLIKLWYWIVNTRITLQKDLKLWQLQTVTAQPCRGGCESCHPWTPGTARLSRRERAAWVVADVIVALAAGLYVAFYTGLTQSVNEFVSLKPNGDSSSVMRVSQFDRHHFIDYSTRNLKSTLRWLDDRGRELPSCTYTHAGQRYCNARLIDPPLANEVSLEWLNYTQIEDAPAAAQKRGKPMDVRRPSPIRRLENGLRRDRRASPRGHSSLLRASTIDVVAVGRHHSLGISGDRKENGTVSL